MVTCSAKDCVVKHFKKNCTGSKRFGVKWTCQTCKNDSWRESSKNKREHAKIIAAAAAANSAVVAHSHNANNLTVHDSLSQKENERMINANQTTKRVNANAATIEVAKRSR
jgi:hypothetical protein